MTFLEYRHNPAEQERVKDLINIVPKGYCTTLEIGARDGYISKLLAAHFEEVTALDLDKPEVTGVNIHAVKGDVTELNFPDNSFDVVLCSEVLEHIGTSLLAKACREIIRVAKHFVVVGVPYKEDIRLSRSKCSYCGRRNPPWGHVNSFDERKLVVLFEPLSLQLKSTVGYTKEKTSRLAAFLMDLADNPYGNYGQEEPCVHCGQKLTPMGNTNLFQRLCSKLALSVDNLQSHFISATPNWLHMVFRKEAL